MAIKRVILHLGMPKAGSASIQYTLYNNIGVLEKNGFRYLTEWERNHFTIFELLFSPYYPVKPRGPQLRVGKPFSKRKHEKAKKYFVDKMLTAMKTTECETLVLSGECFNLFCSDSAIDDLKKFLKKHFQSSGIEVTLILLIRNPLTWITSLLHQTLHSGKYLGNIDFFSDSIKIFDAVINLQKNFSDFLVLLKFEDACLDDDGLVGCFLKAIGFPANGLKNINIIKTNESKCMEAMEFQYFIEAVEPRFPYNSYRCNNPNRFFGDLRCLREINSVKFDLPYQSKIEFWNRFQGTIHLLKESTGIDYTDCSIPSSPDKETYSEETIQKFIEIFPKLSPVLQKLFLKFFEKKYMETAQKKFKQLYFKDSIPWKIYNSKNAFLALIKWRMKENRRRITTRIKKAMSAELKASLKQSSKK